MIEDGPEVFLQGVLFWIYQSHAAPTPKHLLGRPLGCEKNISSQGYLDHFGRLGYLDVPGS